MNANEILLSVLPCLATKVPSHLHTAMLEMLEEGKIEATFIDGGPATLTKK